MLPEINFIDKNGSPKLLRFSLVSLVPLERGAAGSLKHSAVRNNVHPVTGIFAAESK